MAEPIGLPGNSALSSGLDALGAARAKAEFAAAARAKGGPEARKAAEAFEAQFLSQFLSSVFETVHSAEGFDGGAGEEAFRPLLIDEYGKAFAARGGVGVAEAVLREILRYQTPEPAQPAASEGPATRSPHEVSK